MAEPTLYELIHAVTSAVNDLEQRLRTNPMEYLGSLQETSTIDQAIRRLTKIRNDDIDP